MWTAIIAWLFIGEALTKAQLAAIGFGLLGVFIIVKPGIEVVNLASLIVLGATKLANARRHSVELATSHWRDGAVCALLYDQSDAVC